MMNSLSAPPKLPTRVAIYCRLSYAPDGSLEKVERQEADCRQLATRMGWPVSDGLVFPDNSRSAWQRNRKRPQWDRMLKAIDEGEIDALIVYHGDRLIRQPYDLERLIGIADQRGIRIASPSGTRDLDNPDDRFVLRIEAAQACRESDNISRRTTRGHLARGIKGLNVSGGKRPYGWGVPTGRHKVEVDEDDNETLIPILDFNKIRREEAAYLADAVERLLAGLTMAGVIRWMHSEAQLTTEGNPWTSRVLWGLLLSPRMVGMIERAGVLYKAAWDEVVSVEAQQDLKILHERNTRDAAHNPGPARVHLLSGVAECGVCGASEIRTKPMGGRKSKRGPDDRVYYCRACHGVGRNVKLLDAYVEGHTLRLLNDPRLIREIEAGIADGGGAGLAAQISQLERRKSAAADQLADLADHPDVDPGLAMRAISSFERKISELRNRLAATAEQRQVARMVGITREAWDGQPVDVRSTVVRALFVITILKSVRRGPGFDPESVRMERRSLVRTVEVGKALPASS